MNVNEVQDNSEVYKETIKEFENRLTKVNVENLKLKKLIEEKDDAIQDLENRNKPLQTNLKVEKKKNKKERQKSEKNLAEEQELEVKVEPDEKESTIYLDVPTSNKFAVLKTKESDSMNNSKINEKSASSQTHSIQCQICSSFLPLEMSLKEHIGRNHRETSDSFTQVVTMPMISQFQQTTEEKSQLKCFEQYSCFYCGFPITSETLLMNHVDNCHGKYAVKISRDDNQSVSRVSAKEAFEAYLLDYQTVKARKFQCDNCQNIFDSESLLGMHRVFTHSRLKLD